MHNAAAFAALGGLAFVLLGPAPALLQRARWPHREPRAALVLWQAVGLAAGMAVIAAAAVAALAPLADTPLAAAKVLFSRLVDEGTFGGLELGHLVLLGLAVLLTIRLVGVLPMTIWRTWRTRRKHRDMVGLVAQPWPRTRPGDGHVLDHPAPAVYCLPGWAGRGAPRVVFTSSALESLDDAEVTAVLAHEHAHLAERHDLVVLPFFAWAAALPWFPGVRSARSSVSTLLELVADDRAAARTDPASLASALARIGSGKSAAAPAGGMSVDGSEVLIRVRRLLEPPARSAHWRVAAYALAAALCAAPLVFVAAPL